VISMVLSSIYCEQSGSKTLKSLDHQLLEFKRTLCLISLLNMQRFSTLSKQTPSLHLL